MSDVVSVTSQISMSSEVCAAAFYKSELGLDWLSGAEAGLPTEGMSARISNQSFKPSERMAPPPLPPRSLKHSARRQMEEHVPINLAFGRSAAFPPPPPPQAHGALMGQMNIPIRFQSVSQHSPQYHSMLCSENLIPPPPPPPAIALDNKQSITRNITGYYAGFGSGGGGGGMGSEFHYLGHRPLARTQSMQQEMRVQVPHCLIPRPEVTPRTIDALMSAESEEVQHSSFVRQKMEKGRPKRSFLGRRQTRCLPSDDEEGYRPPQWDMAAHTALLEEEIKHSPPPAYAMKKLCLNTRSVMLAKETPGGDTSPAQEETPAPPTKPSFWTMYEDSAELRRAVLLKMIFKMQHPDGYWMLTSQLGDILLIDIDSFVGVALKNKGLCSLGVNPSADILKLLATLLVLQVLRLTESGEGKLLRTLFCLEDSPEDRPKFWEQVKKAVEWVRWADRQYPCICSRLELGLSWESFTRQLLGFEDPPPCLSITMPRPAAVHRVTMTV